MFSREKKEEEKSKEDDAKITEEDKRRLFETIGYNPDEQTTLFMDTLSEDQTKIKVDLQINSFRFNLVDPITQGYLVRSTQRMFNVNFILRPTSQDIRMTIQDFEVVDDVTENSLERKIIKKAHADDSFGEGTVSVFCFVSK